MKPIKAKRRFGDMTVGGKSPILVIGGPAYNMQVTAMHCDTVAMLSRDLSRSGIYVDTWYRASSMLPSLRHELLEQCCSRGADFFLSIDSDTYLMPETWRESASRVLGWIAELATKTDIAFVAAPVRMRNGLWNVTDPDGNNYESFITDETGVLTSNECAWCGTGFVLYNCKAYKAWIEDKEPMYMFGYNKARLDQPWIGEDAFHAMRAVERGMGFLVDTKIITGHGAPEWKGNNP